MQSPDDIPIGGKGAYEVPADDIPIKGGSYQIPDGENPSDEPPLAARGAYAIPDEGAPEEEEKEETGPLEKRIQSKTWKSRCKAYEELTALLKDNPDGPFADYANGLVKYISDSNPGAQEKALDLMKVYLEKQPDMLLGHSEGLVKALVEKGMASAKASIKNESLVIVLDLFSVHKDNFEGFIAGLISVIGNKNIKVQAAAMQAVNSIMAAFGVKKLPFKPFVPAIEKHAAASNPQVRGEALNFYKECYKWVRDLIKPAVEKLKKPQQDELQKAFDEITEAPVPTRWLKHEEETGKLEAASGNKAGKPIDIYEMADAKDIFNKYGEKWCNGVLAMEKWVEKKAALEELNKEADYPKLAEKSAAEIVGMAKRLINDSNVQVMLQTVKLVGLLAKGQRKYFDNYARQFLPLLLQKFKDKKTQVLQETHAGLDNLMFSLTLEQCMDDFKEALEDKTPSVKTNTCQLIERLSETVPVNDIKAILKPLSVLLKKNTDDSTPEVRNCSLKLLGVLLKKCPEATAPLLKDLPAAKMKKIEEASGVVSQSAPEVPKVATKTEEKKEKPKIETPKVTTKKEPAKAQPAATASQSKPVVEKSAEEEASNAISAEEAENIVSGFLPGEIMSQLKNNAWKEKQTGLQQLSEWISANQDTVISQNEAILRFVRSTVKDWKENNFNVVKAAIEIFTNISENYNISKRAAASVLNATALEKLADAKLLEVYNTCIFSLCNQVTPKFVVALIVKNTSDSNKPKVVSECCSIISKIISDYGPHSVALKEIVDYASAGLAQANPAIKKASQALTLNIYSFIGDKLTPLLTEIKESTMKVLQEEFAKTAPNTTTSFKSYKGEVAIKVTDAKKMLDEAMPRANIEKQLPPLLKKLSDGNWKVRKEGLDEFEALLEASKMRIMAVGLEGIVKALAGRIVDANKSLVRQSLLLSGKFAAAVGSESKNFTRQLMPNILNCLGDKQNLLRADAVTAVNKWAEEAGTEVIISFMATPLAVENPELRTELLTWLIDHKDKFKDVDMKVFIQPTLSCLQDKSAGIRQKGESFFAEVVAIVGFESFQPFLKDIKPAVMNTLNSIFDKYKHNRNSAVESQTSEVVATTPKLPRIPRLSKDSEPSARSGSKESQKGKTASESNLKATIKKPEIKPRGTTSIEIAIEPPPNKPKRLELESKSKWSVEEIRQDYQEKMKEQMRGCFSNDLFTLMFHTDFKKQVDGVVFINNLMNSNLRLIIEILDIIFKWVWARLQEVTNTQLLKSILEFLDSLVNNLQREGYFLHEVEANLFLPILCEKSGQNNAQLKAMIRTIIHNSAKIYAPDKVFIFVLSGCNSKNTKSKVECLEELSELVKTYGIEICASKDVKIIAKHAGSSDNNVRNAAVQTMGEIYRLVGDKVWQMTGDIPDKVKDAFEQRFKAVSGFTGRTSSRQATGSKIATPKGSSLGNSFDNSRSTTPLVSKDEPHEIKEQPKEVPKEPPKDPTRPPLYSETHKTLPPLDTHKSISPVCKVPLPESAKITKLPDNIPEESLLKQRANTYDIDDPAESLLYDPKIPNESLLTDNIKFDESYTELDKHIETLRNGDMSSRVDALVSINDLVLNSLEIHKDELQRKANNLSDALTKVIIITFEKPIQEIPLRFAKYFLNVVHKVCCTKIIMKELNETSLFALVEQVLIRLLIEELEKLGEKGEGEAMLKTLNGTMLRMLEHCKPTLIIVVLIRLLTKYKTGTSLQKMTGLIIRCLLKLAKIMPSLIRQIEIGKILIAMHEYLVGSKLSSSEDVGSKIIKTILTEIVKLQGPAVWEAYEDIRKHSVPDVHIERWINELLKTSSYTANTIVSPRNKAPVSPLAEIFNIIKQDYPVGILQLKEYLQKNPGTDLKPFLSTLSDEVSKKIESDLNKAQKNTNDNNEETQQGYNFDDFKKRLTMMKERYGIAKPESTTEGPQTLETLRNKAKGILAKQDSVEFNDANNQPKSRIQNFRNK